MSKFPSVTAHDLEGHEVRVPEDLPAGPRIVMLAFQRWHTELIETWEPALQALAAAGSNLHSWCFTRSEHRDGESVTRACPAL